MTDLPPSTKAIGTKCLFKTKYQLDGTIEFHKSRLVVLGNRQKYGVDYAERFALVAELTTIRSLLAIVAINKWEVSQMDVKTPSYMAISTKLFTLRCLWDI